MARGKSKDSTMQAAEELKAQPTFDENKTGDSAETIDPVESGVFGETSVPDLTETTKSVQASTHAKARGSKLGGVQKRWLKILGIATGALALFAIIAAGGLGQFYKSRIMPNVYVAGINSGQKTPQQLEAQLKQQVGSIKLSFKSDSKTFEPSLAEIGYQADIKKTLENAQKAKRNNGFLDKLLFWKRADVPATVSVNDTLLNQYLETSVPEITKAPVDAQLQFDIKSATFVITEQSDGQGADSVNVKQQIQKNAYALTPATIKIASIKKAPKITNQTLSPLVGPANELTKQTVVLTGLGYTYKAKPADIAAWLTPTPQEDGSVKLIVDSAKIQSYVDSISKRISSIPVDKKIIKDEASGAEAVIQDGRDGTELARKQELSSAIAAALNNKSGTTQAMNIQTAAFKTVNMSAYDKWIEVDLSEQRASAYERSTPVKNFLIASGTRGRDTPVGEFAIWLKTRKQTMQGGSKADGNYYSIPNVEWVSYFYKDYALHGAWWRKQFGYPASHGCVNMTNEQAQWVFEWAPIGTKVIVHQ